MVTCLVHTPMKTECSAHKRQRMAHGAQHACNAGHTASWTRYISRTVAGGGGISAGSAIHVRASHALMYLSAALVAAKTLIALPWPARKTFHTTTPTPGGPPRQHGGQQQALTVSSSAVLAPFSISLSPYPAMPT